MNKKELIEELSKKLSISNSEAKKFLEALLEIVTVTLKKSASLILVGFGTFLVKKRKARKGVNPRTGETIKIPATKVPAFKAGSKLKEIVSGKKKK